MGYISIYNKNKNNDNGNNNNICRVLQGTYRAM